MSITARLEMGLGGMYSQLVKALSPIGFWNLDDVDSDAAVAEDSSGNSRDGVYINTPTLGVAGPTPEGRSAATFSPSSSERVTVASAALQLTAGPLSVGAWVKFGAFNGDMGIAGTSSGGYAGYHLTWYINGNIYAYIGSGATYAYAAVSTTGWHFVVLTWDGTTAANGINLYVDGVVVVNKGTAGSATIVGAPFTIGYRGPDYFNGSIAGVFVTATALSAATVLALYNSGVWTDVSADVRTGVKLEYGLSEASPTSRVAGAGSLTFTLDNSASNSGGLLGYYSLLNTNKRSGFDLNIPVRYVLVNGATSYYKFRGSLSDCVPAPGRYRSRVVNCVALDWMDDASRLKVSGLDSETGKRSDQLVSMLLQAATSRPSSFSVETGIESYEWAFDSTRDEAVSLREELHRIAMSELGYAYIKGDTTAGGAFYFENRQHRSLNPTVQVTLSDDQMSMSVPGSRDDVVSKVQVLVHPTSVDTAATTVLFSLQTTETFINGGATNDSIFGPYRDPSNPGTRIGATAQVNPVVTTDYTMNTASDGSGTDLSANFTVTASFTGNGVRFTIVNNGATSGFVTKLQVRGKGIYRYNAVMEASATPTSYGDRVLSAEMPYQNNVNTGSDVAAYWAQVYSNPLAHVRSVMFPANRSVSLMTAALALEPGHRVAVTETVTGLSATEFTINGVHLSVVGRGSDPQVFCTWVLEPASFQEYWLLGVAGASELGNTTVLGF